jgi:translation initiation factor IF-2
LSRIRIYQLAKDLGLPSAKLIEALAQMGIAVKTASSSVDDATAQAAKELLGEPAAPKAAAEEEVAVEEEGEEVAIHPPVSVGDFAALLDTEAAKVSAAASALGETVSEHDIIAPELAILIGEQWGYHVKVVPRPEGEAAAPAAAPEELVIDREATAEAVKRGLPRRPAPPPDAPPRAPVVTVMGHVDHGKTTLLDTIRKTRVTEEEPGRITQHIGAYQVEGEGRSITFIDTPGHEAFTAMRARGARVTDIAVLVVAADDGVMPQTVEALDHARAAGVPIIVAINKIDRADANVEKTRQQLNELGLVPEEWGGETICVPISALQGTGVPTLLEMILLVADLEELRALRDGPPAGTVLEAELDRRRGPVATVLVQEGTLRVGDAIVAGTAAGKVRALTDAGGRPVKEAIPSMAVSLLGLSGVPKAGDLLSVVENDRQARSLAEERQLAEKATSARERRVSLQDFFSQAAEEEKKVLRVLLKTDVQGTIEALRTSLEQLGTPEVGIEIMHSAAGDITESDIMLASASEAVIIGFQVGVEPQARRSAREEALDIRVYQVIYDLIDDVRKAMVGLLELQYEERLLGRAEVRALFKSSRAGTIAGCYVNEGSLVRGAILRVRREGDVVYEGKLDSLRHLKEDVSEIGEGFECGVAVEGYDEFQVGDVLEAVAVEEVRRLTL